MKSPSPDARGRKKSKPPKQARAPITTAMCSQIFRSAGKNAHSEPISSTGIPNSAGIQDVSDCESVLMETMLAQAINHTPYDIVHAVIETVIKVNCLFTGGSHLN